MILIHNFFMAKLMLFIESCITYNFTFRYILQNKRKFVVISVIPFHKGKRKMIFAKTDIKVLIPSGPI
jgi:hypothetical protein